MAIAAFEAHDPTGYGRIVVSPDGRAQRVIEERDATAAERAIDTVNAGLYAVERDWLTRALSSVVPSKATGELYLTDLIAAASVEGSPAAIVYGSEAELEGVNDRPQFAEVAAALRERINNGHLERGVALIDPTTTWIDVQVQIEPDAVVEPGVTLIGTTSIGARTRIGSGSRIESSAIGEDSADASFAGQHVTRLNVTLAIAMTFPSIGTSGPATFSLSGNMSNNSSVGSGKGDFNRPIGIATDAQGNVFVADTMNHRIQKFVLPPPAK